MLVKYEWVAVVQIRVQAGHTDGQISQLLEDKPQ